jgi:hypothetical protein
MNAFQQTQPLPLMNLFQILSRIVFTLNFSKEWLVARSQSPIPPSPSLPLKDHAGWMICGQGNNVELYSSPLANEGPLAMY